MRTVFRNMMALAMGLTATLTGVGASAGDGQHHFAESANYGFR